VKNSYYEKIKIRWIAHIRKRRISQINAVRNGKIRFEKNKFVVANMMRNEAQLNSMEKRAKDQNELRTKSAQVSVIRGLLRSRQNTDKNISNTRKTRSAAHGRSGSVF
jgi:hypothetical protein